MTATTSRMHLEPESVNAFWRGVSEVLASLLAEMDKRDEWAAAQDREQDLAVLDMIASLVDRLQDSAFANEISRGEGASKLAHVFGLLHSSRFVRLLEMFDKRQPGIVSRLTLAMSVLGGESEAFARLYYERLLVIHRAELLGQVFSAARGIRIAQDIEMIGEVMF